MSQSSGAISSLYKSRQNLLTLLDNQGYDTKDYEEFSVNEVHVMSNNKQLDMLLSNKSASSNQKVYVKYHLAKTLRRENINDYIDDLYNLEQVLTKGDTLVLIIRQELNDPIMNILNQVWEQEGIFIIAFSLDRLQFNILDHEYVPKHTLLTDDEMESVKQKYGIKDNSELPDISRYDPVAQAIGMKPGQMCKILRPSKTAITTDYYRICSQ
jgi:DNA-directed RNA polymerase subunit H (RpoH/RPB5)